MNSKIMDIGIYLVLTCMFGLKKMIRDARMFPKCNLNSYEF